MKKPLPILKISNGDIFINVKHRNPVMRWRYWKKHDMEEVESLKQIISGEIEPPEHLDQDLKYWIEKYRDYQVDQLLQKKFNRIIKPQPII